jgi:hypothetical protein
MILKIFSPKDSPENWRFLLKLLLFFETKNHNAGFRKTPIFRRKLVKIAEISDHNIDPRAYMASRLPWA